jgi:hypothetical protein
MAQSSLQHNLSLRQNQKGIGRDGYVAPTRHPINRIVIILKTGRYHVGAGVIAKQFIKLLGIAVEAHVPQAFVRKAKAVTLV